MISIIIPAYNEEDNIGKLVECLRQAEKVALITEIIVADGGSNDATRELAKAAGAVVLECIKKGRAVQMNEGAATAKAEILYFLHADTFPRKEFIRDITEAVKEGYNSGCYRLQFDYKHWFLQLNCWFTRFDVNAFRFGDQSLFVKKDVFKKTGSFNESMIVFEDQEIIGRIRKLCRFKILPHNIITDARKYLDNGVYRTQFIYFVLYAMYKFGYSQQRMVQAYKSLIKQDKL